MIDSSPEILRGYEHKIDELFKKLGYNPLIHGVVWGDDELQQVDLFLRNYFDVVICDISLDPIGPDNTLGFSVLAELKRNHPGIYAVAYSRTDQKYLDCVQVGLVDLFISKQRIESRDHEKFLLDMLDRGLKINSNAYIATDLAQLGSPFDDRHLVDLNRVVRKLTFTGTRTLKHESISRVRLERMTSGFSGAAVFQMIAYTEKGFPCVQAILKIALTDDASAVDALRRELGNYRSYVRWYLPYHWRPELLGEVTEGTLKAICYAFVSSEDEPFQALGTLIGNGNHAAIEGVIESVFQPKFQRWYHKHNIETEVELMDFYLLKCFGENRDYIAQRTIFRDVVRGFDFRQTHFEIDGLRCLYPELLLLGMPWGEYRSCIIHGDLNTRNVFVPRRGHAHDVTLIDFSETGRGHVFYDFIVFEVNIRLDMSPSLDIDLTQLIGLEQALNVGDDCDLPYHTYVSKLRSYAWANFPDERKESYLYGLATFCFSLLNAPELTSAQVKLLVSCICAASASLQRLTFWSNRTGSRIVK
jgi:hypothetical protein